MEANFKDHNVVDEALPCGISPWQVGDLLMLIALTAVWVPCALCLFLIACKIMKKAFLLLISEDLVLLPLLDTPILHYFLIHL